jgi:hypothetical protein
METQPDGLNHRSKEPSRNNQWLPVISDSRQTAAPKE